MYGAIMRFLKWLELIGNHNYSIIVKSIIKIMMLSKYIENNWSEGGRG